MCVCVFLYKSLEVERGLKIFKYRAPNMVVQRLIQHIFDRCINLINIFELKAIKS